MSDFHKIDQYLHGELSEQERVAFERRLKQEPEFRKAFEAQQKMDLTLQEISREQVVSEVSQKYRKIRRKRRSFLLVTASFILFFLIYIRYQPNLFLDTPKNETSSISPELKELVLGLYEKYSPLANQTNSLDPMLQSVTIIPGNPQKVLNRIKPFAGKNKYYDYYYAHVRFQTGAYKEARQAFQRFEKLITKDDPLYQDYQFFNLLNTIMLRESSSYKSQLKLLLNQETHKYHDALLELSSKAEGLSDW